MPVQSYNPSIFIQRIETVGANATREIVVNTTDNLEVAHSVNILGHDYLIENIDTTTKIVTLDRDRDANIDLAQTPVIEVKQNVPDPNITINTPTPITDVERKEKLFNLQRELYQRQVNKAQEILGTDYYGMKDALESETRGFLGTFNDTYTPILKVLASASGETVEVVAIRIKRKIVESTKAKQILDATFVGLSIKVYQAQSLAELDAISF